MEVRIQVRLNNGQMVEYIKDCEHPSNQLVLVDKVKDYDYEGCEVTLDVFICKDCGKQVYKKR